MNRSPAETASLGRVHIWALSSDAEAEAETPQPPSTNIKDGGHAQKAGAAAGAGDRVWCVEKSTVSLESVSSTCSLLGVLCAMQPGAGGVEGRTSISKT
jgi:hypothetical protein